MGLETCKQLAKKGMKVILTARDIKGGNATAKKLKDSGLDVIFYKLDVTKQKDIEKLASYLKQTLARSMFWSTMQQFIWTKKEVF